MTLPILETVNKLSTLEVKENKICHTFLRFLVTKFCKMELFQTITNKHGNYQ